MNHFQLVLQRNGFLLDVDLHLPANGISVLFGPSGCGKTSLLGCVAGLEHPTVGRIGGAGRVWQDASQGVFLPTWQRPLGYVFQEASLFDHLDVRGNLEYGLRRAPQVAPGAGWQSLEQVIELLGIGLLMQRRPHQLSGGERQRVAIARALATHPQLLLLDEPLGALDLKLRHVMQFELKRIQREVGITFVYVTHDQEEALTMSDRIAVMNAGKVEQIGTPTEIYDRPASVFVAGFIGQANLWHGRQTGRANRDYVEVDVLGSTLRARPGETTIETGGKATVMVRPERVRVSMQRPQGADAGEVCAVRATVTDLTFQGPVLRLSLTADDAAIVAHVGPEQDLPLLRPGDEVYAAWSPDASLVLPAVDIPTTEDLEEMLEDS